MIKNFRDYVLENEETEVEELIPELKGFIDELSGYVLYNDEESKEGVYEFLLKYKNELKKLKAIKKFKKVYRIVALEDKSKYYYKKLISCTKKQYEGDYLKEVKEMIGQYTNLKDKKFYWVEIDNVEGFDFNAFGRLFSGKKKYFMKKYDMPGEATFDVFYDTIKDLKKQNEVIVFEKYTIKKIEEIVE